MMRIGGSRDTKVEDDLWAFELEKCVRRHYGCPAGEMAPLRILEQDMSKLI